MDFTQFTQNCRKRWYIFLALALGIAAFLYFFPHDLSMKELLSTYGYKIIFVLTFLEGETIVIMAGIFAQKLNLHPFSIALAAFCGSFLSDQVMFSLGKYKGHSVLQHFPSLEKNVDKAAALFKKYDIALILGFRFIYGVRNVTPILLGISGVSHLKFFALNIVGASVWALSFAYGGYYAREAFLDTMDILGHGIFYFIIAILAGVGILWIMRSRRTIKRAKKVAEQALNHPIVLQKTHPPDQPPAEEKIEK